MLNVFLDLYIPLFLISFAPLFVLQLIICGAKARGVIKYTAFIINAAEYLFAALCFFGVIKIGFAGKFNSGMVCFIASVLGSIAIIFAFLLHPLLRRIIKR